MFTITLPILGGDYYSVRFKFGKPLSKKALPAYKDHKVTEIEIAPSLYGIQSAMPNTQNEGATAKSSGASPSVGANLLAGSLGQEQAPSTAAPQQNTPAVSGISLSVLKGDVKPSRIEGGTLFQNEGKSPHVTAAPRAYFGSYGDCF